MLIEIPAAQREPGLNRRWFADEYFDLTIWASEASHIAAFELCYDKPKLHRALTWASDKGYGHFRVDAGEDNPTKNRSPILLSDGPFPKDFVIARFTESSAGLDPGVRLFVLSRLQEYS